MTLEQPSHEQARSRRAETTSEGDPETKAALKDLRAEIHDEQAKIAGKVDSRGKRYLDEYKEHDDVLVDQVNGLVDRIGTTEAISPQTKVVMLQKVLRALNDYVGGVDGLLSDKDRVADRLSGILKEFDRDITTAEHDARRHVTASPEIPVRSYPAAAEREVGDEVSELESGIREEQAKIVGKLDNRGNAYGAKYAEHERIIKGDVNAFIQRVNGVPASIVSNPLKAGMLKEVLRTLNDYVGGLDGLFSSQHRVAERLSGILQRFNDDITTAEREARPDPRLRSIPVPRREKEPEVRETYEVKTGDTMLAIVNSQLNVDFHEKPRTALALVRVMNDARGGSADPNLIYPKDVLDIGKAKKALSSGVNKEGIFDWYAGYGHPKWVAALKEIAKNKKE